MGSSFSKSADPDKIFVPHHMPFHSYNNNTTHLEFNQKTFTKPIEVNGIVNDYLIADFSRYNWSLIPTFDPTHIDKAEVMKNYDVGIQNFQYLIHSLLYSYAAPSFNAVLNITNINNEYLTKFSPAATTNDRTDVLAVIDDPTPSTILTKLPYPVEQASMCALPIIQEALLSKPISSDQFNALHGEYVASLSEQPAQAPPPDLISQYEPRTPLNASFLIHLDELGKNVTFSSNRLQNDTPTPAPDYCFNNARGELSVDFIAAVTDLSDQKLTELVSALRTEQCSKNQASPMLKIGEYVHAQHPYQFRRFEVTKKKGQTYNSYSFHYLILSLYSHFHLTLVNEIKRTQTQIDKGEGEVLISNAPTKKKQNNNKNNNNNNPHITAAPFTIAPQPPATTSLFGAMHLDPTQPRTIIPALFPLFSLKLSFLFSRCIGHLFELMNFDDVSPLTITLLLDIYAILHYYSLYFRWSTFQPIFMNQLSNETLDNPLTQHSLFPILKGPPPPNQTSKSTSTYWPPSAQQIERDTLQPAPFTTYDAFIAHHYKFPTLSQFLFDHVPPTHLRKVLSIFFNHAAFYITVESEFIARTYKPNIPHASFAISEPPPFPTLTKIGFEASDASLLHVSNRVVEQHLDFDYAGVSKNNNTTVTTTGSDVLPKMLINVPFPDAPQLSHLPEYDAFIKPFLEPVFFPQDVMNKIKMVIQKFSWRMMITNYDDIASLLAANIPSNHRQLAVGYIATLLYENRRFQDLTVLLLQYNIAPCNPLYTMFNHVTFSTHYARGQLPEDAGQYHSASGLPSTKIPGIDHSKFLRFVQHFSHETIPADFSFINTILSTYTAASHNESVGDDKLQYLIQLWLWLKYQNRSNSAAGISPFLLQPVSIHYHHYYQYCLGNNMFVPLLLLGRKAYKAMLNTVLFTKTETETKTTPITSFHQIMTRLRSFSTKLTDQSILWAQNEGAKQVKQFATIEFQAPRRAKAPKVGEFGVDCKLEAKKVFEAEKIMTKKPKAKVMGSNILNFQLLNRMNPHIIEAIIAALVSAFFTLALPQSPPTIHHLNLHYSPRDDPTAPPPDDALVPAQSRLLLGCATTLGPNFRKLAESLLTPSVVQNSAWFQHFSRLICILRNNSQQQYSLDALFQLVNGNGMAEYMGEDGKVDARIKTNNRHVASLFDNLVFFAYLSAIAKTVHRGPPMFIPMNEADKADLALHHRFTFLPHAITPSVSPILDFTALTKPMHNVLPTFVRHDQFLNTFQLLFSDVANIFSTNVLWYAGHLFRDFFATQPELQTYLKQSKESEYFAFSPSFHLTSIPATTAPFTAPSDACETIQTAPPAVPSTALKVQHTPAISASIKIDKFITALLPYSLDSIYMTNQFNPYVKLNSLLQLRILFFPVLFFGQTYSKRELDLILIKLRFSQAVGALPSYKTYFSSPWFVPQLPPDAVKIANVGDFMITYTDPHKVTRFDEKTHQPYRTKVQHFDDEFQTAIYYAKYNEQRNQSRVKAVKDQHQPIDKNEQKYDPISTLLTALPTSKLAASRSKRFVFKHLNIAQMIGDVDAFHRCISALYATGFLSYLSIYLPSYPLHYIVQLLQSLRHILHTKKINPIKFTFTSTPPSVGASAPLPHDCDLDYSDELSQQEQEQEQPFELQQFIYELVKAPNPARPDPYLNLYNTITLQSIFLPSTLPYFAPSLFSALLRVALNALERLIHLWDYQLKYYEKNHLVFDPAQTTTTTQAATTPSDTNKNSSKPTLPSVSYVDFHAEVMISADHDLKRYRVDTNPNKAPKPNKRFVESEVIQSAQNRLYSAYIDSLRRCYRFETLLEDKTHFLDDLDMMGKVQYCSVARIEPYEYAAIWLLFGANPIVDPYHAFFDAQLSIYDLVRSYESDDTPSEGEKDPLATIQNGIDQFFVASPELNISYNILFISQLATTIFHCPVAFAEHVNFLLYNFSNFALYWQFLESFTNPTYELSVDYSAIPTTRRPKPTRNKQLVSKQHPESPNTNTSDNLFIAEDELINDVTPSQRKVNEDLTPSGVVMRQELNNHNQAVTAAANHADLTHALQILDFDLPTFSTPWDSAPSVPKLTKPPEAPTPTPTPTSPPPLTPPAPTPPESTDQPLTPPPPSECPQPNRQGLLYFLYDSIIPNANTVDEALLIMTNFNDADRVFVPPAQSHNSHIDFLYVNPTTSVEEAVTVSIVDGVLLRCIQRQQPIEHLELLFQHLSPHLLDYTMHIQRSYDVTHDPTQRYDHEIYLRDEFIKLGARIQSVVEFDEDSKNPKTKHPQYMPPASPAPPKCDPTQHAEFYLTTFALRCTVREYIHVLYPNAAQLIEHIETFHKHQDQ